MLGYGKALPDYFLTDGFLRHRLPNPKRERGKWTMLGQPAFADASGWDSQVGRGNGISRWTVHLLGTCLTRWEGGPSAAAGGARQRQEAAPSAVLSWSRSASVESVLTTQLLVTSLPGFPQGTRICWDTPDGYPSLPSDGDVADVADGPPPLIVPSFNRVEIVGHISAQEIAPAKPLQLSAALLSRRLACTK